MGRKRPRPRARLRRSPNRWTAEAQRQRQDSRVAYGVHCTWWDSIHEVGQHASGLPCCPHCGSVLMEVPDEKTWWSNVDAHERKGNPGYRELINWMRGKCFRSMDAARAAYEGDLDGR